MERPDTRALFHDLVRRGLLDWQGRSHAQGALPWPWLFGSTVFQLTPLARGLRRDEDFSDTAFAAAILLPVLRDLIRQQAPLTPNGPRSSRSRSHVQARLWIYPRSSAELAA